ncbi:MAG TPA: PQQ-dependent sugar dehydrogenase, partial [Candidatus Thermoplasmatota archaeon]|nr:PQQ-dependent sugar dehydrogenase [Candidatus Thermoplasmatota archaeon]
MRWSLLAVLLLPLLGGCSGPAQTPAASPGFRLEKRLDGLDQPVALVPDGATLLVAEQEGRILRWDGKAGSTPTEALDLRERVKCCGEQGLLGIARDPHAPGTLYVHYSGEPDGRTVLSRFVGGQEQVLLEVPQPYPNHNGGWLAFGPDGMLYLGLGDGGSGGDPHRNAQSLGTLLGKLLRIDVRVPCPAAPCRYAIPADNPFAGGGGRPEIWAYGLRNPWRASFDRETGDLWVADVGQNQWEEVNVQPAGARGVNYGWNRFEGTRPYRGDAARDGLTFPVAEYSHAGGNCSVTGGVVYRGAALPGLRGTYLY